MLLKAGAHKYSERKPQDDLTLIITKSGILAVHPTRRQLLASIAAAPLAGKMIASATAETTSEVTGAGSTLTKITIVETSGNSLAPHFIPPSFGHPFKKGDIAKGSFPHFSTPDGAACPYTMFNAVYWSDGSLKFACFLIRPPVGMAANGKLEISIGWSATPPGKSSRSATDLSSDGLNLQVQIEGLEHLSGIWTSHLNNGIGNKNQSFPSTGPDIVHYADGAVGRIYRIRSSFEQAGAPHGQLECYWYCALLEDASGNLYGIRYLGRVTQPWYNNDAPAKSYRAFRAFRLQDGSTVLRDCMSDIQGESAARTVTHAGSNNQFDVDTTNLQPGMLVQFSTTGELPTGLLPDRSYFVGVNNFTPTKCQFYTGANGAIGGSVTSIANGGSGVHTLTPYPYLCHFGSLWTCGPDGKWDYAQARGSVAKDATARVEMSNTYWRSTKMVPPFDIDASVISNHETRWFLNCAGPVTRNTSQTGERDDIGVMPSWHVRHFYSQSALDETCVRVVGLVGGTFSTCLKDTGTKSCPVANDVSYAGMPTKNQSFRWTGGGPSTSGFQPPANIETSIQGFAAMDTSHLPAFSYYAYLLTGEPQFFDCITEWANSAVFNRYAATAPAARVDASANTIGVERNPTINGVKFSGTTLGASTLRQDAWAMRDVAAMVALCPKVHPENASYLSYFTDLANATWDAAIAFNRIQTPFWLRNGVFVFASEQSDAWMQGYWIQANAFAYAITEIPNALTILNHAVKFPSYVRKTFGGWHVGSYQEAIRTTPSAVGPLIKSDAEFGIYAGTKIIWASGNPNFTIGATLNYQPTESDKFIFSTLNGSIPGGFSQYTPYYVVSASGPTVQLAAAPGGAAITPTSSGGNVPFMIWSRPTNVGGFGLQSAGDYASNIRGALNYAIAVGATVDAETVSDLSDRIAAAHISYAASPKYHLQSSF